MNILITGSAGQLAKALIPKLLQHPEVDQIIGVDNRVSDLEHPRLHNHLVDVRIKKLVDYFYDIDIVIHMAFVVMRQNLKRHRFNRALVYDINVNGSINVFTSAAMQGVKKIIYLSSAVVYGSWPNNPFMMKENNPRRPMPRYSYAEDKVAVENWLDRFEPQQKVPIVRLRPHIIVGPNCHRLIKFVLKQPFYPFFRRRPMLQCVWEDDVADAIVRTVFGEAQGSYNLAANPPMSLRQMIGIANSLPIGTPFSVVRGVQRLLWYYNGAMGEPGWLSTLRHSLTVDSNRAMQELGWKPSHSTEDCLRHLFRKYESIV